MSSAPAGLAGPPVKAVYRHLDCLLQGIHDLHAVGIKDFTVLSPFPRHEIDEILYKGEPSPVRWFTLLGAMFGGTMVFSLASLTHANWPMIIPGGKPLVSIPPFIVLTFEGTILWGAMFTLFGLLKNCRLPAVDLPKEMEDPRFSNDCFGIVFERSGARLKEIVHILEHSGASEVTHG
jgi:molybdopterin-containing oxidoreductase family membrane subunit